MRRLACRPRFRPRESKDPRPGIGTWASSSIRHRSRRTGSGLSVAHSHGTDIDAVATIRAAVSLVIIIEIVATCPHRTAPVAPVAMPGPDAPAMNVVPASATMATFHLLHNSFTRDGTRTVRDKARCRNRRGLGTPRHCCHSQRSSDREKCFSEFHIDNHPFLLGTLTGSLGQRSIAVKHTFDKNCISGRGLSFS